MRSWIQLLPTIGLAALATCAAAHDALTDAIQSAYAPYRAALVRTNMPSPDEALQALQQARALWDEVLRLHGRNPPPPYDRDRAVVATLEQVARIYERAEQQVRAGSLAEAHETLEAVRDLLAELRQRNGVVTYSDHINAYHAEMETVIKEGRQLTGQPQDLLRFMARVGVLEYLLRQLADKAPASLRDDPGFASAWRAVQQSVAALQQATLAQDVARIRAAVEQLKKPYSVLFLRYG